MIGISAESGYLYDVERVEIDTINAFSKTFSDTKIESGKLELSFINKTETLINTEIDYLFTIRESDYCIKLSGSCERGRFSQLKNAYSGVLNGSVMIDGIFHEVIAHIIFENKENIQLDISIQPDEIIGQPICFTVGRQILKNDWLQTMMNSSIINETVASVNSSSYSFIGNKNTAFSSSTGISGNSQDTRVYFNSSVNRVAVGLKSYCNNVRNYYMSQPSAASATAYVTDFSIELRRNGTDGSYIAGLEEHHFSSFGAGNSALGPLFEDALSLLGIPTSSISNILNGRYATCTESVYTNVIKVNVTGMSATQSPNFDSVSCGLPIIFQLNKGTNTSGQCSYIATTSIKYGIIFVPNTPIGAGPRYYYVNAGSGSKTVSLILS